MTKWIAAVHICRRTAGSWIDLVEPYWRDSHGGKDGAWKLQEKMQETNALTMKYFVLSVGELNFLSPISIFLGLDAANCFQIGALPSVLLWSSCEILHRWRALGFPIDQWIKGISLSSTVSSKSFQYLWRRVGMERIRTSSLLKLILINWLGRSFRLFSTCACLWG